MSDNTGADGAAAMDRLLVPLDRSAEARAALPYAMALATAGTEIRLLTVVAAEDEVEAARAALEATAQPLRGAGHTIQTEVVVGDPAEGILAAAGRAGAGVIVMASRGRGAVGRLIYGSVADRVAREATLPTMVVRSGEVGSGPVAISRLVAPLDGSPLAEASLPVATAIAKRLGAPLALVRAVNPIALLPPAIGLGESIPPEIYEETEVQIEQEAREYLEGIASSFRDQGLALSTEVLMGAPATAIGEATQPGDVIVLTSHERSGVLRWLLGSVAEQLTREDQSPVILVPAREPEAVAAAH